MSLDRRTAVSPREQGPARGRSEYWWQQPVGDVRDRSKSDPKTADPSMASRSFAVEALLHSNGRGICGQAIWSKLQGSRMIGYGSKTAIAKQIGNAVPTALGQAIAPQLVRHM